MGHLNAPWLSRGLHSRCHIDGVAPKVVGKLGCANNCTDSTPRVDTNPDAQLYAVVGDSVIHPISHLECCPGNRIAVVITRNGSAGDDHVSVAHGLDLFDSVISGNTIECREDLVEDGYRFGGIETC